MRKFLLYTIIFLSLFVGTATCVIVDGYNKYTQNQTELQNINPTQDSALTSLATNVLNAKYFSGDIKLVDSSGYTSLSGGFSYINDEEISVQIELQGMVNKQNINTEIILLNNQLFIDFNNQKFMLGTDDLITALSSVISSINTTTSADLPKLDMAYAQSLLSNITTTETSDGYLIQGSIPKICEIFIKTDSDHIPQQILLTNLKSQYNVYTIEINAKQTKREISDIKFEEYLDISPVLGYLSPAINTLMQENLCIYGTLNLNGSQIKLKTHLIDQSQLRGSIEYEGLVANFQFDGSYILLDLYGNCFKLTINELFDFINHYFPNTIQTKNISSLQELANEINLSATVSNNKISNLSILLGKMSFTAEVGFSWTQPKTISADKALTKNDIIVLIDSYKNLISNHYSIDLNIKYEHIELAGQTYLEVNDSFTGIEKFYFNGTIQEHPTTILHSNEETYIQIDTIKLKLQNSALGKTFNIILDYLGEDQIPENSFNLSIESLLNKVKISGRTITINTNQLDAKITSYVNTYQLAATINSININAYVHPGIKSYSRIANSVNKNDFKSFDNAPQLLNALKNTLNKGVINFSGYIDINILDFSYKNIGVSITTDTIDKSMVIVLDNLPLDPVITYLNDLYYTNQRCVLTIVDNVVEIHTTVTHRFTQRITTIASKTVLVEDFGIENLYDIMSMRKSIIDTINNNSTTDNSGLTNLSTECIDVYKAKTHLDINAVLGNTFTELYADFYYAQYITKATMFANIKDILFINIRLEAI